MGMKRKLMLSRHRLKEAFLLCLETEGAPLSLWPEESLVALPAFSVEDMLPGVPDFF